MTEIDNEAVEAVARALCRQYEIDDGFPIESAERSAASEMYRNFLKAARAAIAAMPGWRTIDSAPKDGSFVLLYVPNGKLETGPVTIGGFWKAEGRADNGRFKKGDWARADFRGWLGTDADYSASWCDPTHWRHLPAPPKPEGS